MEQNNLVILIMLGIPCSGKTTWVSKNKERLKKQFNVDSVEILSKDEIRYKIGKNSYKYTKENEHKITTIFYKLFSKAILSSNKLIIIDNTHVQKKCIESYIQTFNALMNQKKIIFKIKVMNTPYWLCAIRSFFRRITTGRKTPLSVIKEYDNVIKSINLENYKKFFL